MSEVGIITIFIQKFDYFQNQALHACMHDVHQKLICEYKTVEHRILRRNYGP